MADEFRQSQMNIGTLGHVDHGKTTLTRALTGTWTDTHSESVKRSMTIKLGYADSTIKKCANCEGPQAYTIGDKCEGCDSVPVPVRRFSILDAPGHETLMATAIAGSNIIDAVLFVIAATEACPMPQTKEHLVLINLLGIKNIIVVQSKVDVVGKKAASEHYLQIKAFLKGSAAEEAPIIPVMANKNVNVDVLFEMIANTKLPDRDMSSDPLMYIARSFDANRPGTEIEKLAGGVIGGSIVRGTLRVGDKIEIRPGRNAQNDKGKKNIDIPILTSIQSLSTSTGNIDEAVAGGLIAVGTTIDPAITKADGLVGNVLGMAGKLPEVREEIALSYKSITRDDIPKQGFLENEPVLLGIGTATVVGHIKSVKKNSLKIVLKRGACADKEAKISVLRNIAHRWRLTGYGSLIK
jgi:translation initiation factor 2 subunit 3